MTDAEATSLLHDWNWWARPNQLPPEWDWTYWLIMAGRGFGKTRTGAEWVRDKARTGNYVNLIGATADDARDIMVEGESGILAICPPWERPYYKKSERKLIWPNGAESLIFTADEPERLRGKQHSALWADEVGCLISGSLVETDKGKVEIESIQIGDFVHTRNGLRRVKDSWQSSPSTEIWRLDCSDGRTITGTPNHPVFVKGKGFVPLALLQYGDIIETWEQNKASSSKEKGIGSTVSIIVTAVVEAYIEQSIKMHMVKFLRSLISIISTETKQTTLLKILKSLRAPNTLKGIAPVDVLDQENGDKSKRKSSGRSESRISWSAKIVEKLFPQLAHEQDFVQIHVNHRFGENCILTSDLSGCRVQKKNKKSLLSFVHSAAKSLRQTIRARFVVQENAETITVKNVKRLQEKQPVYNLSVEGEEEYYANEILVHNSWRYQEAWDQAMFGLRLGIHPQAVITTTPRPIALLRDLLKDKGTALTTGKSVENRANLAPSFFDKLMGKYQGTRLGRQELDAELLDDVPGALWQRSNIDANRVKKSPDLVRIVVAIDPAGSSQEGSDETGIVVAGKGMDGHFYVLEDRSGIYSPNEWATQAIALYKNYRADRIIGEVNNGGEMVENTIRSVDRNVSYKAVHASRGKVTRAEPVSSLYEQNRCHHVGSLPVLEDQMCIFTTDYDRTKAGYSPDRMDSLVWAMTELGVETSPGDNLSEFYKRKKAEEEARRLAAK